MYIYFILNITIIVYTAKETKNLNKSLKTLI